VESEATQDDMLGVAIPVPFEHCSVLRDFNGADAREPVLFQHPMRRIALEKRSSDQGDSWIDVGRERDQARRHPRRNAPSFEGRKGEVGDLDAPALRSGRESTGADCSTVRCRDVADPGRHEADALVESGSGLQGARSFRWQLSDVGTGDATPVQSR